MKLLFLDIDGVLNSGSGDMHRDKTELLNRIMDACPEVRIVISSSWRYWLPPEHIENELCDWGGVSCRGRVIGCTEKVTPGARDCFDERVIQIRKFAREAGCSTWVVLDDLALDLPELVKTDPRKGLTAELADEVIRRFKEANRG